MNQKSKLYVITRTRGSILQSIQPVRYTGQSSLNEDHVFALAVKILP